MFALFEAGLQRNFVAHNPMLRRCAPCMGLTMWHLSEVRADSKKERISTVQFEKLSH